MTSAKDALQIFEGKLSAHWETGFEAHMWALEETGKKGYDGLHAVDAGDFLIVFNDAAKKKVLWKGVVDYDHDGHKQIRPMFHSPVQWVKSIGHVDGLQKNEDPETWGKMFSEQKPAILIAGPNHRH